MIQTFQDKRYLIVIIQCGSYAPLELMASAQAVGFGIEREDASVAVAAPLRPDPRIAYSFLYNLLKFHGYAGEIEWFPLGDSYGLVSSFYLFDFEGIELDDDAQGVPDD